MKEICIALLAVIAISFTSTNIMAGDPLGDASVIYTRVLMDHEGQTYFADTEVNFELKDFAPPAGPVGVAAMQAAKTVVFTTADGEWRGNWHPAPRKQFVFMLDGAIEIEVADGEIRQFSIGDIILLEDVSGKGHDTRVVSAEPALFAIVTLPETP